MLTKLVGFDAATRTVTLQLPRLPAVTIGQWAHLDLDDEGCGADFCPRATVPGQHPEEGERSPSGAEYIAANADRWAAEAAKLDTIRRRHAEERPTPPTVPEEPRGED